MPYIVTVCKTCDCLTDAPGHGPEDEYCEAPDGFERIELFTEREIATRSPQDEDHEHRHDWRTTGMVDTGHQPVYREWECECGEREWTDDDDGPARSPSRPSAATEEGDDASRPGQR